MCKSVCVFSILYLCVFLYLSLLFPFPVSKSLMGGNWKSRNWKDQTPVCGTYSSSHLEWEHSAKLLFMNTSKHANPGFIKREWTQKKLCRTALVWYGRAALVGSSKRISCQDWLPFFTISHLKFWREQNGNWQPPKRGLHLQRVRFGKWRPHWWWNMRSEVSIWRKENARLPKSEDCNFFLDFL